MRNGTKQDIFIGCIFVRKYQPRQRHNWIQTAQKLVNINLIHKLPTYLLPDE